MRYNLRIWDGAELTYNKVCDDEIDSWLRSYKNDIFGSVIMRNTGVVDSYGNDIYEGDMCKLCGQMLYNDLITEIVGEGLSYELVYIHNRSVNMDLDSVQDYGYTIEVVGNKYEG